MSAHERGSALVLALFVVALLTAMGTSLLFLSQHESRMSRTSLLEKRAFYLAEGGVEDARLALFAADVDRDFDDELTAAAGADGAIDFDLDALRASYDQAGNVTGITGFDDDVPLRPLVALDDSAGQGWYAAFLTNDPAEGRLNMVDANQRVMITALGAGGHKSIEIVQAIVAPFRILPPTPAAAVTMLGPLPAFFDNGTSGAQTHTGDDCGTAGGEFAPIVGTVSPASKAQVQTDMNRPENFSAGPLPFTGTDTVADLTDLTDPIVAAAGHGMIDPIWTDCAELKALIEGLARSADYYCDSDLSTCTFPTTTPESIVFIDGDLAGTPSGSFSGMLVVTGELTYNGSTGWNGIVLIVGEGRLFRSGGGSAYPSGGVIIASIDPTPDGPAADRSDWCSAGVSGFAQSFYDASGGGNSTIQWCSTHLDAANSERAYRVVEFIER